MKVDYSLGHFNIHDFADAIQSRIISNCIASDHIARLQAVEISFEHISSFFDPKPVATIIPRLRQLREIGLEITFLLGGKDTL
jgi:predicted component of type VI protein secretion system